MAKSVTPTSSLSLRLPVGVSAILSGFMAICRGRETATAHCANGPRADTPELATIVAKREAEDRGKAGVGIELATDWPSGAPAPAAVLAARRLRLRRAWLGSLPLVAQA